MFPQAVVHLATWAWIAHAARWEPLSTAAYLDPLPAEELSAHDVESLFIAQRRPRNSIAFMLHLSRLEANMAGRSSIESGSMDVSGQLEEYIAIASLARARTICEIGLNGGHSALSLIHGSPLARRFYSFDLAAHAYVSPAWRIVADLWAHTRRELGESIGDVGLYSIAGDSAYTVPDFFVNNTGVLCDLFHIDGAHHAMMPSIDLRHAIANTRPGGFIVSFLPAPRGSKILPPLVTLFF